MRLEVGVDFHPGLPRVREDAVTAARRFRVDLDPDDEETQLNPKLFTVAFIRKLMLQNEKLQWLGKISLYSCGSRWFQGSRGLPRVSQTAVRIGQGQRFWLCSLDRLEVYFALMTPKERFML